jgi:hypothetical protein
MLNCNCSLLATTCCGPSLSLAAKDDGSAVSGCGDSVVAATLILTSGRPVEISNCPASITSSPWPAIIANR